MTNSPLADLFPRPSDEARERRRAQLVLRGVAVLRFGWDDYRYQWSTGEVVAVAALVEDNEVLKDLNETFDTAYRRWAYDLWGMADAQTDEADGLPKTRNWFAERTVEIYRALRDEEFENQFRVIRGW